MSRLKKVVYTQIKSHAKELTLVLGLMMITSGIQAISPWPFKILIDNVLGSELVDVTTLLGKKINKINNPQGLGIFVIIVYFLINIASNIFEFIQSKYTDGVIRKIIQNFSLAAFKNLESFDIGYYRQQKLIPICTNFNARMHWLQVNWLSNQDLNTWRLCLC